ncbi:biotin--[acetyl-CoA-carboxylase] ligase [Isoptericola sp. S6320L]|uniref:biotin--[acetyl-CoA-carboxylase] ligase n=1 Tax=Isoptericola sp. S6320L TaxID=2926411 RepID=UPI001FF1C2E1|nr:biotin--[acetyl-CoA-carboxylase] ligase [Isoptericola sp. S6320L]MCK0116925.1 biotin--[acetyl-CoA-carboxylase] ligase [Isoptericola sp. S6320L]
MNREPLDVESLRRTLCRPAGPLARLDVVEATTSTSSDLADRVRAGSARSPAALAAEHQTAGRGRAGRTWQTPARAALTVSFLLRPQIPRTAFGWVPLVAGLAVVRTLAVLGCDARLKWPNDVLLPAATPVEGLGAHRKVAGVLAEVVPDGGAPTEPPAVVVGIGTNVSQRADELPVPTATSLALAGAAADRTALLVGLVHELTAAVGRLEAAAGDAAAAGLAQEYAAASATLGTRVRAELAGGDDVVVGTADRVADDGALVLATPGGERVVTAGDVHHLRAHPSPDVQGAPR